MQEYKELAGIIYDNFNELKKFKPELADELLDTVGEGEWQDGEINVYESVEDFAYYELTQGWYADLQLDGRDYNGAPDPFNFIDLNLLGHQLIQTGDDSCQIKIDDMVITTGYGW